jgi:hypothetical protein
MIPIDTETFGERLRRLRETKGWRWEPSPVGSG